MHVYNLLGQKIRTLAKRFLPAGAHVVRWDGRDAEDNLLSSVYVYSLRMGDQVQSRSLMLVK